MKTRKAKNPTGVLDTLRSVSTDLIAQRPENVLEYYPSIWRNAAAIEILGRWRKNEPSARRRSAPRAT